MLHVSFAESAASDPPPVRRRSGHPGGPLRSSPAFYFRIPVFMQFIIAYLREKVNSASRRRMAGRPLCGGAPRARRRRHRRHCHPPRRRRLHTKAECSWFSSLCKYLHSYHRTNGAGTQDFPPNRGDAEKRKAHHKGCACSTENIILPAAVFGEAAPAVYASAFWAAVTDRGECRANRQRYRAFMKRRSQGNKVTAGRPLRS